MFVSHTSRTMSHGGDAHEWKQCSMTTGCLCGGVGSTKEIFGLDRWAEKCDAAVDSITGVVETNCPKKMGTVLIIMVNLGL